MVAVEHTNGAGKTRNMRYERLAEIVRLALRLQSAGGQTLDDIQQEFLVSRRTAERMRDAVEHAFGPLELEDMGDGKRHWRLRSNQLRNLLFISADELVELETATAELERTGFDERATLLRDLGTKLGALLGPAERRRLEPDLEALMMAEGLAMRPGPRPRLEAGLLMTLRDAIKGGRVIDFRYLSRMTGRRSRQRVQPHGLLYGSRAYLVGRSDWTEEMRYWVLANMSEVTLRLTLFQPGDRGGRKPRRGAPQERRQGFPEVAGGNALQIQPWQKVFQALGAAQIARQDRRREADGAVPPVPHTGLAHAHRADPGLDEAFRQPTRCSSSTTGLILRSSPAGRLASIRKNRSK